MAATTPVSSLSPAQLLKLVEDILQVVQNSSEHSSSDAPIPEESACADTLEVVADCVVEGSVDVATACCLLMQLDKENVSSEMVVRSALEAVRVRRTKDAVKIMNKFTPTFCFADLAQLARYAAVNGNIPFIALLTAKFGLTASHIRDKQNCCLRQAVGFAGSSMVKHLVETFGLCKKDIFLGELLCAFRLAVNRGNAEVVDYFISHFELTEDDLACFLEYAITWGHEKVLKVLASYGVQDDKLAFTLAVKNGQLRVLHYLHVDKDYRADPSLVISAFSSAISSGHVCCLKFLMDQYKLTESNIAYEASALKLAAGGGHVDVLKWLRTNMHLSVGNCSNSVYGVFIGALYTAVSKDKVKVLECLHTDFGMNMDHVRAASSQGQDLLNVAVENNSVDVMCCLQKSFGMDTEYARSKDAISSAILKDCPAALKCLHTTFGLGLSDVQAAGTEVLSHALRCGKVGILRCLKETYGVTADMLCIPSSTIYDRPTFPTFLCLYKVYGVSIETLTKKFPESERAKFVEWSRLFD